MLGALSVLLAGLRHGRRLLLPLRLLRACEMRVCVFLFMLVRIAPGVGGMCFFIVFSCRPGEPKGPKHFFHQKTPWYPSKRPGAYFLHLHNQSAPGGVCSHYYDHRGEKLTARCLGLAVSLGAPRVEQNNGADGGG